MGYSWVKNWTRKLDIFSNDLILFPINYKAVHWILAVYQVSQKAITIYNSARGDIGACFLPLVSYLKEEHLFKRKSNLDIDQLEGHNIPKQKSNDDCGVFTLRYAESITRFGHHGGN